MALLPTIPAGATVLPRVGRLKSIYRPAVVCRLLVRLEDFSNADGPIAQSETNPAGDLVTLATIAVSNAQADQAARRAAGEEDRDADIQAILAEKNVSRARTANAGGPSTGSAAPEGVLADDFSFSKEIVPFEISVELNGFTQADKCDLSFSLTDLPLDPEIVRSVMIEVYWGTIPSQDFAQPDRWVPRLLDSPPMFRGYADKMESKGNEEDNLVTISADSLEKRLMDAKINPMTKARRIHRGGEKVTAYIRRLLSTVPEFNGTLGATMGVVMFPNVDPAKEPVLDSKLFNRSLQSAASRVAAGGGNVQGAPPTEGMATGSDPAAGAPAILPGTPAAPAEFSVWDLITRAANLAGVIPVYDPSVVATDENGRTIPLGQNNLLLMPPQTVKETPQDGVRIAGGPTDGFNRQFVLGGTTPIRSEVRFFVWGKNIRERSWSRQFGRKKTPRVRVVGYNPDGAPGKRTLTAVFPEEKRGTSVSALGSGTPESGKGHNPLDEEVIRVVHGIRDLDRLKQIAVSLFHQISRREISVTIMTDELSSYIDPTRPETNNENPDLLRLRPGTPCRVMVGRQVTDPSEGLLVNSLSELFDRRFNGAFLRKALIDRPGSGNFLSPIGRQKLEKALTQIEAAYQKAALTDWFYCRSVRHKWNAEDGEGYSAEIELANYVVARSEPGANKNDVKSNDSIKMRKKSAKPDANAAAISAGLDQISKKLVK